MKALVLRLDAPLMSFGGVLVDQHGFIERFPGTAMLTGLLANALGWRHRDFDRLQLLQQRLRFAARWDVEPERIVDYHTADLGQPKMREPGWTTRGKPEHRAGSPAAKFGTHIRYRHHWADGLMTVALGLQPDAPTTLEALQRALARPARPLFLGRKACLPARPLLDPEPLREGPSLRAILQAVPRWDRHGQVTGSPAGCEACWPAETTSVSGPDTHTVQRHDLRNWASGLPEGSREQAEGLLGESA